MTIPEQAVQAAEREAVLNYKAKLRAAFRKALSDLPEIAPSEISSILSSVYMKDEFWREGKRLQLEHGLDAVAPRLEQECGAGAWSFIRQGILTAAAPHLAAVQVNSAKIEAARKAVEELANVQMNLSLSDWSRLSSVILSALEPSAADCPCTLIQQDETCPVGYPSLLCEICDGKGVLQPSAARELALEEAARVAERTWPESGPLDMGHGARIAAAIRTLSSPDPADAGKVEGEQSAAARDVLAERRRQVEAEGWTPEHDDQHSNGEMARAASCYITNKERRHLPTVPLKWPWSDAWWKPDGYRRNLVKAGALILAEIERLDRLPSAPSQEVAG